MNVPSLITYLKQTPIFEWCVVRCGSKNGHQKGICFKDWTTCSKFVDRFMLNGLQNWRAYLLVLWLQNF